MKEAEEKPEKTLSVKKLLAQFEANQSLSGGEKLAFAGVEGRDVYNITAPFQAGGETIIAGRVEERDSELAEMMFFVNSGEAWTPRPRTRTFEKLQDPCVTRIGGELIVGGVEFPIAFPDGSTGWRMSFYRGKTLEDLTLFLTGPERMKDIRLVELPAGRIGVFSRPQGDTGGRGTIGFTTVDALDQLTAESIDQAPLLHGQFRADEWGGANEAHVLRRGRLGVLGHIACMDQTEKHYYPMVFAIDPETRESAPPRIIAARKHFPAGPAKRPDLVDIIFSGGLRRHADGTATLYAGISDAEAAKLTMPDPFLEYEQAPLPVRSV